uniref:Immunoglobulin V-set domain-containing protein n=1 Tax=Felis catus TaxID=9685 RepID=A0ABI7Z6U8_FELCA
MGSCALCYVALFLLGRGLTHAEIYQTPAVLLSRAGRHVTLERKQNLRCNAMDWYWQDPGRGLRLIYYSTVEKDVQRGDITEGHSVSREEKALFPLTVKLAHTSQTGLYLCSGSAPQWSTATGHLHAHLLQPRGPTVVIFLNSPSAE